MEAEPVGQPRCFCNESTDGRKKTDILDINGSLESKHLTRNNLENDTITGHKLIHGISEEEELARTMHKVKPFWIRCNEVQEWVGYKNRKGNRAILSSFLPLYTNLVVKNTMVVDNKANEQQVIKCLNSLTII